MFKVELEQDDDGRWSATIPALAGCGAWGYTKEEALQALREAAQAYLEVSLTEGRLSLPEIAQNAQALPEETIAVTV
ncbi:MAG: type II toxin-antitoxin system HicB family antitoxin [Candidatus Bipolaricaulota bacterium]|nr:type II toxin-antitoxin system HicB family antitoxin [Candidatus Bipolaricaulota bacterium]